MYGKFSKCHQHKLLLTAHLQQQLLNDTLQSGDEWGTPGRAWTLEHLAEGVHVVAAHPQHGDAGADGGLQGRLDRCQ
jgi:hypothetical protein